MSSSNPKNSGTRAIDCDGREVHVGDQVVITNSNARIAIDLSAHKPMTFNSLSSPSLLSMMSGNISGSTFEVVEVFPSGAVKLSLQGHGLVPQTIYPGDYKIVNPKRSVDIQDKRTKERESKVKVPNSVTMDSVILPKEKKERVLAALSQISNHTKIFEDWGFDQVFEKGTAVSLLFWGIPGTGKTLMAQAISDQLGAELKTIGAAEIETAEPGGAERNIQKVFAEASEANKDDIEQVILFDECDSLLMDRNAVGPIIGATINCLLSEIEKFKGVVIFTTNRLGKLDAALERRISAKIEFTFPDPEQRELIWNRMIPKKAPLEKDVDLKALAAHPIAGGNIKNAVLTAARSAAHNKQKKITQANFVKAVEQELAALDQFRQQIDANDKTRPLVDFLATRAGFQVDRTIKEQSLENLSQTEFGQEIRQQLEETEAKLRLMQVGIQGRVN